MSKEARVLRATDFHLDRVVEGLEDADALGAQLQVDQPLHVEGDAVVLHGLLTHQQDDAGHRFLPTHQRCHEETTRADNLMNNELRCGK